jgi:hypothetical protein
LQHSEPVVDHDDCFIELRVLVSHSWRIGTVTIVVHDDAERLV